MTKQTSPKQQTATSRLVERQRRLWAHAEAIEIAQKQVRPLPADISEWLHRALRNIACGDDANVVFDVVPEKQGVRKDAFLSEIRQKLANGYVAAATEPSTDCEKKTTSTALSEYSRAAPSAKKATVRKNWNKVTTDRKPTFTLGKK